MGHFPIFCFHGQFLTIRKSLKRGGQKEIQNTLKAKLTLNIFQKNLKAKIFSLLDK